ncbi:c-type cytochrome [Zhengella mangrovi]|nr:c-type cytochrome [Zhengella mangrovi]
MKRPIVAVLAAIAGLAAAQPASAEDAATAAGKLFFGQRCQICHNPNASGGKTYGPPLAGVVGRKAGSVEGFAYSDALKNSGIVWTEASLKAWMADNDGMLPGTRMRHVGVEDPAEQEMIVAYLKSLAQ